MTIVSNRPGPARRVKAKVKTAKPAGPSDERTRAGKADNADSSGHAGLALGLLPDFVGYPLRRAQIAVFDDFMRTTGQAGLRPGQFSTLLVIDANPGSKQTDVAAALGIHGTNFVAMINELEARDLVERRAFDRRSYALHLTQAGKKLLVQGIVLQSAQEEKYEAILGPGGRQLLLGLLARLMAGIEARNNI